MESVIQLPPGTYYVGDIVRAHRVVGDRPDCRFKLDLFLDAQESEEDSVSILLGKDTRSVVVAFGHMTPWPLLRYDFPESAKSFAHPATTRDTPTQYSESFGIANGSLIPVPDLSQEKDGEAEHAASCLDANGKFLRFDDPVKVRCQAKPDGSFDFNLETWGLKVLSVALDRDRSR